MQHYAEGAGHRCEQSACSPGSQGALLRNLAGSEAIRVPQRSVGGNLQCQGRTQKSRLCPAVASLDQKPSLKEHGAVTCQAGLGWLACRVYHKPLYWAARQCHSWTEAPLQQMLSLLWLFPGASHRILRSCSDTLVALAAGGSSVTLTCFLQADDKKCPALVPADTEDGLCRSAGEF